MAHPLAMLRIVCYPGQVNFKTEIRMAEQTGDQVALPYPGRQSGNRQDRVAGIPEASPLLRRRPRSILTCGHGAGNEE